MLREREDAAARVAGLAMADRKADRRTVTFASVDSMPGVSAVTEVGAVAVEPASSRQPVSDVSGAAGGLVTEKADTSDRMFLPEHFAAIQRQLSVQFTLDAAADPAGSNAHCPRFCSSSNSFLKHDCSGQYVWINPPFRQTAAFLKHYLRCKAKAPSNTCAAIVVPAWETAAWRPLLTGMSRVRVYPAGTVLFSQPAGNGSRSVMPGVPWPVEVWFDPVRPPLRMQPKGVVAASGDEPRLMSSFRAKVAGADAWLMLDSGATVSFASRALVERLGMRLTPTSTSLQVEVADGNSSEVLGEVHLPVRCQSYKGSVPVLVLGALVPGADLILGQDWLKKHRCTLSYERDKVTLWRDGKMHTLNMEPTAASHLCKPQPRALGAQLATAAGFPLLLTHRQAKRVARKGQRHFLVVVKHVSEQEHAARKRAAAGTRMCAPKCCAVAIDQPPEGLIPPDELAALLADYPDVTGPLTGPSKLTCPVEVIQQVPGAKPTWRAPFRMSAAEKQAVEEQVADLLAKGFIQPSSSPFGAPILFVPKPDGSLRMCLDYRLLNATCLPPDRTPIPNVADLMDTLNGATIWSAVDLAAGYWQLKLQGPDQPRSAFNTHIGQYEWTVLPMGLTNAPAVFQRVMTELFRPYLNKFVLCYLDDVLIYSKTPEEHLVHLRLVFDILREAGLRVRLQKCVFNKAELHYLGFVVSREGLKADPRKVAAVEAWPTPATVHELRQFLGLANFFRKFIQGYSSMVSCLNALIRNDAPSCLKGRWSTVHDQAFAAVKHALTSAPVLKLADPQLPYEVTADASVNGTGAVLTQEGRPIAYYSHKFTPAERNWTTGEQELFAVVQAMKEWRCYLEGAPKVTLVTDHHPLIWLQSQPTLSRKQARWMEYLSRFVYTWKHIPGRKNVADPLSRVVLAAVTTRAHARQALHAPSGGGGEAHAQAHAVVNDTPLNRAIKEAYASDEWFSDPLRTANLTHTHEGYWLKGDKVVVPNCKSVKHQIMHAHHDVPSAGHPGAARTMEKVARHYWWPALRADVEAYVRTCDSCQRMKSSTQSPAGLLQPLPVPSRRWGSVSMDLVTALTPSHRGNDAILVFVCRLSKMVHFAPCKHTVTAQGCADLFMQHVFRLHGVPDTLVSDRDPRWLNDFWTHLCTAWEVRQTPSTSYHPQTDGQTERMIRLCEETLRHYVGHKPSAWEKLLPCVEFAINDSKSGSTGQTPFMVNYGEHPRGPTEAGAQRPVGTCPAAVSYTHAINEVVRDARAALEAAQARQKAASDKHRRDVAFAVGDQVLLSAKNLRLPGPSKMRPRWVGPYRIEALVGKVAAKLTLPESLGIHPVFHFSLLKPYRSDGTRVPVTLPIVWDGQSPLWRVQRIVGHRKDPASSGVLYIVQWEGFPPECSTEVRAADLTGCDALVEHYWAQHRLDAQAPPPVPVLRRSPRLASRPNTAACIVLVQLPSGAMQARCVPVDAPGTVLLRGGAVVRHRQ